MLGTAWRLARRELRGGLAGFRVFLACLALGVAAIAAVGTVGASIRAGLEREGAVLLGGDAEVQLIYRFADPDERAWLESVSERVSEIAEFRSLAVAGEGEAEDRALTRIKAVDGAYPLFGEVRLEPDMPLAEALADDGVVIERVLAERLELAPGDTLRLGTKAFRVAAIIAHEPDGAAGGFAFGPKTLVLRDALEGSGLLAEGTLFDSSYRLDLPEGADLAALEAEADGALDGSGARWRDARNGAPGIGEFVERLESFLTLVGLAGLAVGGVGVAAAVRAYLARKVPVIATLRTLGAERRTVLMVYLMQIAVLAALGIGLGLLLGALGPLMASPLIEAALPIPAEIGVYPGPLLRAAAFGALAAGAFALWPLARLEEVRPAALYRASGGGRRLPRWPYLAAIAVMVAVLVGGAALSGPEPMLAVWVALGVVGALLVLQGAALGVRWLARRSGRAARGRPALRAALAAIGGPGEGAGPVILSLGLGLTVLAAIGQIDTNLRTAISRDLPERAPSFFFLDIQPDQLPGFLERVEGDPAVSEVRSVPMLRGVITGINGRPAEETAGDHWVLSGDRGVTYAATPEEETVVEGEWWPEDYRGPPLVSFSAEEGEEMNLALGDTITVNILGRDITATVASFRDVAFETAGMGFVMVMDPATLSAAPHTSIATVTAETEAEGAILRDVARAYPNVTAIAVKDAIEEVSAVLDGLAAAIRTGAGVTLLTGFAVLIGAAAAGEGARVFESAVLKTLGAARGTILRSFALRSALLGLAAGTVALAAGALGAWGVVTFVMEGTFELAWGNALMVILGGAALTLGAGLLFAVRPLGARPARVLRARE